MFFLFVIFYWTYLPLYVCALSGAISFLVCWNLGVSPAAPKTCCGPCPHTWWNIGWNPRCECLDFVVHFALEIQYLCEDVIFFLGDNKVLCYFNVPNFLLVCCFVEQWGTWHQKFSEMKHMAQKHMFFPFLWLCERYVISLGKGGLKSNKVAIRKMEHLYKCIPDIITFSFVPLTIFHHIKMQEIMYGFIQEIRHVNKWLYL